jgi:hypothetical protein
MVSCLGGALNEGECTDIINLDLSKAFDRVHHMRLLTKKDKWVSTDKP